MASPWWSTCRSTCRSSPAVLRSQRRPSHNSTLSTAAAWHTQTTFASSRVQIYTSRNHNPFLNLSAEHLLLQHSHPDSTILFLYTNDPCVVIGRNQNPWLEVNLALLHHSAAIHNVDAQAVTRTSIALVRRRSGGGTVFHDRGNVNFSVICPPAAFDRDRHAEMVVRALRGLGAVSARVNERHDIVVDAEAQDGGGGASSSGNSASYKISGSAYKLTRLRALHHGTCLLSSPNLGHIGKVLRSPAEPYIKARGVESVRSPICNVGLSSEVFMDAVAAEFRGMYGEPDVEVMMGEAREAPDFAHEQIQKGYLELTSREWIYNQTPQFTFSTHPTEEDSRTRPALPPDVPEDFRATITARHGEIQQAIVSGFDGSLLQGEHIHRITDWRKTLESEGAAAAHAVGKWFNHLFGTKNGGPP